MNHVKDASSASLLPFIYDVVAPGASVKWDGLVWVCQFVFVRLYITQGYAENSILVAMHGVQRVASLLKGWFLDTHQGNFVPEHLQAYLEKFAFRFNRRTLCRRGLDIHRLLEQTSTLARSIRSS